MDTLDEISTRSWFVGIGIAVIGSEQLYEEETSIITSMVLLRMKP